MKQYIRNSSECSVLCKCLNVCHGHCCRCCYLSSSIIIRQNWESRHFMQKCPSEEKYRDVKKCPALRYKDDSWRRQKRLQVSHAEREWLLWTEESNAQKVRELVKPCSILVLKSWMSKWRAQHRSPMRVSFPLNTQLRHRDCHFVLRNDPLGMGATVSYSFWRRVMCH